MRVFNIFVLFTITGLLVVLPASFANEPIDEVMPEATGQGVTPDDMAADTTFGPTDDTPFEVVTAEAHAADVISDGPHNIAFAAGWNDLINQSEVSLWINNQHYVLVQEGERVKNYDDGSSTVNIEEYFVPLNPDSSDPYFKATLGEDGFSHGTLLLKDDDDNITAHYTWHCDDRDSNGNRGCSIDAHVSVIPEPEVPMPDDSSNNNQQPIDSDNDGIEDGMDPCPDDPMNMCN